MNMSAGRYGYFMTCYYPNIKQMVYARWKHGKITFKVNSKNNRSSKKRVREIVEKVVAEMDEIFGGVDEEDKGNEFVYNFHNWEFGHCLMAYQYSKIIEFLCNMKVGYLINAKSNTMEVSLPKGMRKNEFIREFERTIHVDRQMIVQNSEIDQFFDQINADENFLRRIITSQYGIYLDVHNKTRNKRILTIEMNGIPPMQERWDAFYQNELMSSKFKTMTCDQYHIAHQNVEEIRSFFHHQFPELELNIIHETNGGEEKKDEQEEDRSTSSFQVSEREWEVRFDFGWDIVPTSRYIFRLVSSCIGDFERLSVAYNILVHTFVYLKIKSEFFSFSSNELNLLVSYILSKEVDSVDMETVEIPSDGSGSIPLIAYEVSATHKGEINIFFTQGGFVPQVRRLMNDSQLENSPLNDLCRHMDLSPSTISQISKIRSSLVSMFNLRDVLIQDSVVIIGRDVENVDRCVSHIDGVDKAMSAIRQASGEERKECDSPDLSSYHFNIDINHPTLSNSELSHLFQMNKGIVVDNLLPSFPIIFCIDSTNDFTIFCDDSNKESKILEFNDSINGFLDTFLWNEEIQCEKVVFDLCKDNLVSLASDSHCHVKFSSEFSPSKSYQQSQVQAEVVNWKFRNDKTIGTSNETSTVSEATWVDYEQAMNQRIEQGYQLYLSTLSIVPSKIEGIKSDVSKFTYDIMFKNDFHYQENTKTRAQRRIQRFTSLTSPTSRSPTQSTKIGEEEKKDDQNDEKKVRKKTLCIVGLDSSIKNEVCDKIGNVSRRWVEYTHTFQEGMSAPSEVISNGMFEMFSQKEFATIMILSRDSLSLSLLIIADESENVINSLQAIEDSCIMQWRRDVLHNPETWSFESKSEEDLVDVSLTSDEVSHLMSAWSETLNQSKIIKIERVQNSALWERFANSKITMMCNNDTEDVNEQLLWHGTRQTNPNVIIHSGLDFRYSGQGMWGRATYFATKASYSQGYCFNSSSGVGQMFFVRVILGRVEERASDTNIKCETEGYDSIQGVTSNTQVHMVYHVERSYPEYLVTFKK